MYIEIEIKEIQMTRNEKQAEFISRFINNLGDVKNWEHNGEVVELQTVSGTCVCGHPIKFLYYIEEKNTHRKEALGSECINNFKDYNLELYESLIKSKDDFKERKKKEKLQPIVEDIEKLKETYDEYSKIISEYKQQKGFISKELFNFWLSINNHKEYKTLGGKKRYLSGLIDSVKELIQELDCKKLIRDYDRRKNIQTMIKNEMAKDGKFFHIMNQEKISVNNSFDEIEEFFERYYRGEIQKKKQYLIQVFGKGTYKIKEQLKQLGYKWSGDAWIKTTDIPDEKIPEGDYQFFYTEI